MIIQIDLIISSGIIRAAKEYMVSDLVFGWGEKTTISQRIFGTIFDHLLNILQTLFAVKMRGNLADYKRFIINVPSNLEHEPSFASFIGKISKLPNPENELEFRAENEECFDKIKLILPKRNKYKLIFSSNEFNEPEDSPATINSLFLLRKQSVSYNTKKQQHGI